MPLDKHSDRLLYSWKLHLMTNSRGVDRRVGIWVENADPRPRRMPGTTGKETMIRYGTNSSWFFRLCSWFQCVSIRSVEWHQGTQTLDLAGAQTGRMKDEKVDRRNPSRRGAVFWAYFIGLFHLPSLPPTFPNQQINQPKYFLSSYYLSDWSWLIIVCAAFW